MKKMLIQSLILVSRLWWFVGEKSWRFRMIMKMGFLKFYIDRIILVLL